MRSSNKVILGTLFCAAVSATAKGQDIKNSQDSSGHHSASATSSHVHGGFFGFLRRHHNNSSSTSSGNLSHTPRTGGFGNTLRGASS